MILSERNFRMLKVSLMLYACHVMYHALFSNANPKGRDPLTLSISRDGLLYIYMFYLAGGRHIDYPPIIEHDKSLYISFSGAKQTLEVLKVDLDDYDKLMMLSK